jgi:hypothetical protein
MKDVCVVCVREKERAREEGGREGGRILMVHIDYNSSKSLRKKM